MVSTPPQALPFYPVAFPDVSGGEIIEAIAQAEGRTTSFVCLNAHTVYLAERDAEFLKALGEAYCFCDGFGIHLLAMLQGLGKPLHRNTPTDFMWDVFARLHAEGKRVYLLGDEPGVAKEFAEKLDGRFPGLVCGFHHGFFAAGSAEEEGILREINERAPHLLCVGMGQPRQEMWVYRFRDRLRCPAALHLGASMAFAIGRRRRGPKWATDNGLEWLFRVLHEPGRMFSRYFVEIPWLAGRALLRRWRQPRGS
jgi:N-acetylglucosaminyldiphosphoundecaprenol N-acetyl-beta-D-mannosaminyltransferase